MNTAHLRQLLEKSGYTLAFKEDDWIKCLVSGHNEQWLGKGFDENGALQDVARQMFPSRISLDLLDVALVSFAEPAVEPAVPTEPYVPALAGNENVPPEPTPEPEPEKLVVEESPAPVTVDPTPEPEPEPEPVAAIPPEPVRVNPSPIAAPMLPPASPPVPQTYAGTKTYVDPAIEAEAEEEKISREEGLEIVEGISDELTDNVEDVAMMTTHNQKLQICDWIFRARTIQEQFPTDHQVEEAVHRIAVRLTALCKTFWPGSVRALQVYTIPSQAIEGIVRTSKTPLKWVEAAEIIAEHMEATEARRNYDEFGWCDTALLNPEPPNPYAILQEAVKKIEGVLGELGGPLDDKRRGVPGEKVLAEMEELVMAAHLLRWIRRAVSDKMTWGYAMGALRWASRQPRHGAQALREIINDDYRPSKNWAEMLGRDPEINRKNRLRKQVMKAMPETEWLEEDLMSWLHNAFQVFTNPQIAKLAGAVHSEILEFTNADFADTDRHTRSRLRKLQGILRNKTEDLSRVNLPSEDELAETDDGAEEEVDPKSSKNIDPTLLILAEVQKLTEGKHILFVTNRDDVRLQQDLERELKCKVTLKDGGRPSTMRAVIKSVDGDRYDFVLMATGFNNHSADAALCRATKAQGLPYVRVQKGRLAATIRALGRAFNVTAQGNGADEANVAHVG